MRYRVIMSITIDATNDRDALAQAKKLDALLKGPLVKMGIEAEGVRLSGDGSPIVHQPRRAS